MSGKHARPSAPPSGPPELLERLEGQVEALAQHGVHTLGDLVRTLGETPQASRLKELLSSPRKTRSVMGRGDGFEVARKETL